MYSKLSVTLYESYYIHFSVEIILPWATSLYLSCCCFQSQHFSFFLPYLFTEASEPRQRAVVDSNVTAPIPALDTGLPFEYTFFSQVIDTFSPRFGASSNMDLV